MKNLEIVAGLVLFAGLAIAAYQLIEIQRASAQTQDNGASLSGFDAVVHSSSDRMMKEGSTGISLRHLRRSNVLG